MRRITLFAKTPGLLKKKPTVYLKSPGGDLTVCGTECKRVGELKSRNGITFDADACDVEIFIVFSENPEFIRYSIPDGERDTEIMVVGSSASELKFSTLAKRSNWFSRLDGEKRVLLIICAVVVFLVLVHGLAHTKNYLRSISKKPETFETGDVSITLTHAFVQEPNSDFYALYFTKTCTASIIREHFDQFPNLSEVSYDQYCKNVINSRPQALPKIVDVDGITCLIVEFDDPILDQTNITHAYIYRSDDAYWIVQFTCPVDNYDYWSECFDVWANSLKFK